MRGDGLLGNGTLTTSLTRLSSVDVQHAAELLAQRNEPAPVYGVPRGGRVPAALVAAHWRTPLLDDPEPGCLVVDDLIDSGETRARFAHYRFDALFRKSTSPDGEQVMRDGWLVFPWEDTDAQGPADAVRRLLQYIGEDPDRNGLVDTPARVLRALRELTQGYALDPAHVLARRFEQDDDAPAYQGIVLLRDVPFASTCEHHLLPFIGTASVAYIPQVGGTIVGLSKLARLVDLYAQRLQVQERMTVQIVTAIERHLAPRGAACMIRAEHSCMNLRGVKKHTGGMVTSELRGLFFDDARAREELMALMA